MGRYDDIDPRDLDPDTGRPYAGYSSPALDTSFHDAEMAGEEDPGDYPPPCTNPGGHRWVCSGTQYGGDDERWGGEGRCYCEFCGADGDA